MGTKTESSTKVVKVGNKDIVLNIPGYDGSLYDSLKQMFSLDLIYEDGLLKKEYVYIYQNL